MAQKPIVIADDHPLFRSALRQAVAGAAPERDVVETSSLTAARAALGERDAGLLCLDLHMEDSDGFAGLLAVRQDFPDLPVAIVSASEAPHVVRRASEFGAAAFIPKSSDLGTIRTAIAAVLDGDIWTPPDRLGPEDPDAEAATRLATLTATQLKVLLHVHQGLLNKQIAHEMSISEATVKAHLTAIFRKLEVQTRTQAVIAALQRLTARQGRARIAAWTRLAETGQEEALVAALLAHHYDPAYARASARRAPPVARIVLDDLSDAALDAAADELMALLKRLTPTELTAKSASHGLHVAGA